MWNNYLIISFLIVMLPHTVGFIVKYTLPKRYNLNTDISMSNTDIPTNVLKYNIHPSKIINRLIYDSYQFGNEWSYSEFLDKIDNDKIAGVSILENGKGAIAIDNDITTFVEPKNLHSVKLFPSIFENIIQSLTDHKVNFDVFVQPENGVSKTFEFLLNNSLNIIFLTIFLSFLLNTIRLGQNPNQFTNPMSYLMGENKELVDYSALNTTFADVAGCDEAKYELIEVVDFLKNSTRFVEAGAKIPKGVLLEGSPGTGKTMLARAVASEANVSFVSASGSEFIEMFVGVGASRVRKLFDTAKENSPCVLFIDEIDAVGRQRGAGIAGGNDEREQTLNQILTNMDGFEETQGIVVIAATNRIDILDNALTRPGRFDRKITVPLPDFDGRKQIAKVHFKNKNIDESVDYDELSSLTGGFSGADIANLANEAAIFSVRNNKTSLDRESLLQAYEKITIGLSSNTLESDPDIIDLVSYHEAGHALMASLFPEFFNVRKVTINANKGGAGGYTLFTPHEKYQKYASKKFLLANLIVAMGGRAAEVYHFRKDKTTSVLDRHIFRDFDDLEVTTGATNDIMQANKIARDYITRYGFGKEFGQYDNSFSNDLPFVGREMGTNSQGISESTKNNLDNQVQQLVNFAYETAVDLITRYSDVIEKIVVDLKEKTVISGSDIVIKEKTNENINKNVTNK